MAARSQSLRPPLVRGDSQTGGVLPPRPAGGVALRVASGKPPPPAPASTERMSVVAKRESSTALPTGGGRALSLQRYNPAKCADPFQSNTKKCRTSFAQAYLQGNIPCRLQSSAAKFQIQWDSYALAGFSPDLLVVCADGLCELEHPFVVMAPLMFEELIRRAEGVPDMFAPVIETIAAHIRKALLSENTTAAGLKALLLLAAASGPLLQSSLGKLIPAMAKPLKDKKHSDTVAQCFALFEQNCGPEATKLIKSKIPTYS